MTNPSFAPSRPTAHARLGVLSDRGAVVLALCVAGGALASRAVPLAVPVVLLAAAVTWRRPALLCLGAAVLASTMGARCWAGLVPPPARSTVRGTATLVSDPAPVNGLVHVELRLGHRRVDAWARGAPADLLMPRLAGERVEVSGRLAPVRADLRPRLATRHIAAHLSVQHVGAWRRGPFYATVANGLRRTLERGAVSLPGQQRALFTGFVLGDARGQSQATADDFRNAGLTHLLVVSGENVAFVLALCAPLLRLLGLRWRLVAGLLVLAAFGVLTRWEPSVLRAEGMAALALVATTAGRPASTLRLLALAVAGLVIVDPVLVRSVGFLLSVGACCGIALWAAPLARRMPGPRFVREPLAVTLAAQAGVAPVLIPVFGGLPVAAVPANLLAVPAAGPVTMWGMTAGVGAGMLGGQAAAVLHLPTRVLVGWTAAVAHVSAGLPLGHIGLALLVVVAIAAALCLALPRAALVPVVAVAAIAAVIVPAVAARVAPPADIAGRAVTPAARLWRRHGATVLVLSRPPSAGLSSALRRAGVHRLDVLAVPKVDSTMGHALDDIQAAVHPRVILSPPGFHRAHLVVAVAGARVTVGRLRVDVTTAGPPAGYAVAPR